MSDYVRHPPVVSAVCVFCGSSVGARPIYVEAAKEFGHALAGRRLALVYGGGKVGLMGEVANAVLERGGRVMGVIPRALVQREIAHDGLTELHVVETMHERKAQMSKLADAFVALPGGLGTLDELFEIWTWWQLGIHDKPIGLLNVNGFFDPLITMIATAAREGFIRPEHAGSVVVTDSSDLLLDGLMPKGEPAPE